MSGILSSKYYTSRAAKMTATGNRASDSHSISARRLMHSACDQCASSRPNQDGKVRSSPAAQRFRASESTKASSSHHSVGCAIRRQKKDRPNPDGPKICELVMRSSHSPCADTTDSWDRLLRACRPSSRHRTHPWDSCRPPSHAVRGGHPYGNPGRVRDLCASWPRYSDRPPEDSWASFSCLPAYVRYSYRRP